MRCLRACSGAPPRADGAVVDVAGRVALVTGGASGIGECVARRLSGAGAAVVIADVDAARGEEVAARIGAAFVRCDVSSPADNRAAVEEAVRRFGGLDIAFLNAGVGEHGPLDESFDERRYRRMVAINLDGVVHGFVAALPALRARGGGDVVATASLAGLTPMPADPVYTATKHAVVGLVRSLAPTHLAGGIRINALCPGFADTPIVEPIRDLLTGSGMPLLDVEEVADAFMAVLDARGSGECWFVQPGRASEPYRFRGIPGPVRR